jgi:hypothetical protein
MDISTFTNGDKKAIVRRENHSYTVYYYLNNKVIKKDVVEKHLDAEDLAEDYVMLEDKDDGLTLLNENA